MINKVINILTKPYLIPRKIINFIRFNKLKKNYNFKIYENDQNEKFNHLGLDREKGIFNLNQLKKQNLVLNRDMSSEHDILFSSIALLKKDKILNILEIGTHDGVNSFLLSLLFKNSKIKTIDLESKNYEFQNSYSREKILMILLLKEIKLLTKAKIYFLKNKIHLDL